MKKVLKQSLALLLCLIMALGTAVTVFASDSATGNYKRNHWEYDGNGKLTIYANEPEVLFEYEESVYEDEETGNRLYSDYQNPETGKWVFYDFEEDSVFDKVKPGEIREIVIDESVESVEITELLACVNVENVSIPASFIGGGITAEEYAKSINHFIEEEINPKITEYGITVTDAMQPLLDAAVEMVVLEPELATWLPVGAATYTVAEDNPALKSVEGKLYSKDGKVLLRQSANIKELTFGFEPFLDPLALIGIESADVTITEAYSAAFYGSKEEILKLVDKLKNDKIESQGYDPEDPETDTELLDGSNLRISTILDLMQDLGPVVDELIDLVFTVEMSLFSAKSFTVSENDPYLRTEDGILYNKDMTALIKYPVACGQKTYRMPASVVKYSLPFITIDLTAAARIAYEINDLIKSNACDEELVRSELPNVIRTPELTVYTSDKTSNAFFAGGSRIEEIFYQLTDMLADWGVRMGGSAFMGNPDSFIEMLGEDLVNGVKTTAFTTVKMALAVVKVLGVSRVILDSIPAEYKTATQIYNGITELLSDIVKLARAVMTGSRITIGNVLGDLLHGDLFVMLLGEDCVDYLSAAVKGILNKNYNTYYINVFLAAAALVDRALEIVDKYDVVGLVRRFDSEVADMIEKILPYVPMASELLRDPSFENWQDVCDQLLELEILDEEMYDMISAEESYEYIMDEVDYVLGEVFNEADEWIEKCLEKLSGPDLEPYVGMIGLGIDAAERIFGLLPQKIVEVHDHVGADPVIENSTITDCAVGGTYDSVVCCKICGEELSRETITVSGGTHIPGAAVEENNTVADCTAGGTYDSVTYCAICGKQVSRTTVPVAPRAHEFGRWVTTAYATCTEDGVQTRQCVNCQVNETRTSAARGHNYDMKVVDPTEYARGYTEYRCKRCGDFYREDYVPATWNGGYDIVEFGSYPQTRVKLSALDELAQDWKSYGYYSGTGDTSDGQMTAQDYMEYCDVTYNGEKYRGVRFSQFRPIYTGYEAADGGYQYSNGYYDTDTIYWFRYEPLRWRVLDAEAGLVLCETVIDSQPFNNYLLYDDDGTYRFYGDADKTYYASNYAQSSVRAWLNGDFADTAFTPAQRAAIEETELDNGCYYTQTGSSYNKEYDAPSTTDKVFLLSYSDIVNPAYGFNASSWATDPARKAGKTDYAACQGLYPWDQCAYWLLRTAHYDGNVGAIYPSGDFYYYFNTSCTYYGIRPAIRLDPETVIVETGDGSGSITVDFGGSGENPYAGLILRAKGTTDGGAQYSAFVTGSRTLTLAGLSETQNYTVELAAQNGVVFGRISNVTLDEQHNAKVAFSNLKPRLTAELTVTDYKTGAAIDSGYTVRWTFTNSGAFAGTGNTVADVTTGTQLSYEITLSDALAAKYYDPGRWSVTIGKDGAVSCQLSPFDTESAKGTVLTSAGDPVPGAVVSILQQVNEKSSRNTEAVTDENGVYTADVVGGYMTVTVQKTGYQSASWDGYASWDDSYSTREIEPITLYELTGAKLTLDLTETAAGADSAVGRTSAADLDFTVSVNSTEVYGFTVQYPALVLEEGIADGAAVTVTATDRSGDYLPATATLTYSADADNTVSLHFTEKGHVTAQAASSGNDANLLLLFDASGNFVRSISMPGLSADSGTLSAGTYTAVLIGSSSMIGAVPTLSMLADYGLASGTDYYAQSVTVKDGEVTALTGFAIPKFDETKLYQTDPAQTSLNTNVTSVSVGQNVLLRASYSFAANKTVSDTSVKITLPDACTVVLNSLTVDGYPVTKYDQSGNILTVPTNGSTGIVRLYVCPQNLNSGNALTFAASLSCTLGGRTFTQPIGTAQVTVREIEWSVPARTADTHVTVTGKTAANATIQLYDNEVLVGTTNSNSAGSFSIPFELVDPGTHSEHDLYLVVQTGGGYGTVYTSAVKHLIYDADAIMVSKVTMRNTGDNGPNVCVFDYLNPSNVAQNYRIWPGRYPTFTFEVEFTTNDPSKVTNVFVVTTDSSGRKTFVPVKYNDTKKCWIGTYDYDGRNCPAGVAVRFEQVPSDAKTFIDTQTLPAKATLDPSGYVCEAVPSNRLEGVTVTCREYYSSDTWNASEFDQTNPLLTDANGYYEWFVPEGLWQVCYEKSGYITGTSDSLPVPPPQTEVNYAMTSTALPQVSAVHAYPDGVELRFSQYMDLTTVTKEAVTVSMGNAALTGSIIPVNAEASFADATVQYASVFKFVPDMETALSGDVTVRVEKSLQNYAGNAMNGAFTQTVPVEVKAESVKTEDHVNLIFSESKAITLSILPAAAGAGKTITIISGNDGIVSAASKTVTTDENGQATIMLKGELPGATSIDYNVDGTNLLGSIAVAVDGTKEVCQPVTAMPESGAVVEEGSTVTLATATNGASIYYTLDGTNPIDSETRILYTEPITLTESVTINAYAVKDGLYDSSTTSMSYTVNPKSYAVRWQADGKTILKETVRHGDPIEAPAAPAKEGYTFTGWDPEVPATMPANSLTFTAKYTKNSYKVNWVIDGKTETKTVEYGAAIEKIADPVKEGYTFTGWDAEAPATMPANDLTFTAQFTKNSYKVNWVIDGKTETKTVEYGAAIEKIGVPVKEGYTFTGWDAEAPATMPANDLTFTAQFTKNSYKVNWVIDGKTETKTVEYGAAIEKIGDPVKEGYTFTGWDAEVPATMPAHDLTFRAQFTKNETPPEGKVHGVTANDLPLKYKEDDKKINAVVAADEGVKYTVTYDGYDKKIIEIKEDGRVITKKKGTTDVKITVKDEAGNAVAECTCKVTVKYTFIQWIIIILLFGWIWFLA